MSYTCLLMVLCECTNLISKANFNLINRTELIICLHIMFQISFKNSKGQKRYCKFWGVRSELLLSNYVFANFYEIPSIILQDIKETKRHGHTVGCSFGQCNSKPAHKHSLRGYKNVFPQA